MDPSFAWPTSETGRWLAATEWAIEFCANRRALGYSPGAVVAQVTGDQPESPVSWNEAKFLCVEGIMRRQLTYVN